MADEGDWETDADYENTLNEAEKRKYGNKEIMEMSKGTMGTSGSSLKADDAWIKRDDAAPGMKVKYVSLDPVKGVLQPYDKVACEHIEEHFREFLRRKAEGDMEMRFDVDSDTLHKWGLPPSVIADWMRSDDPSRAFIQPITIAPMSFLFRLHHDAKHPQYNGIILIDQYTNVDLSRVKDDPAEGLKMKYDVAARGYRNVRRHHMDAGVPIPDSIKLRYGKLLEKDTAGNEDGDEEEMDSQRWRLARHRHTMAKELVDIDIKAADLADVSSFTEGSLERQAFDAAEKPLRHVDELNERKREAERAAATANAAAEAAAADAEEANAAYANEEAQVAAAREGAEEEARVGDEPALRLLLATPPNQVMEHENSAVVVFGSINMDLKAIARMALIPNATGNGALEQRPGGKGANEAVAIARLGVRTALVGRVGPDDNGKWLMGLLKEQRVDISKVDNTQGVTSTAVQIVTREDGNKINVVCDGLNQKIDASDVERAQTMLREMDSGGHERLVVLLLQLEVNPEASLQLIKEQRREQRVDVRRRPIALKPSPLFDDVKVKMACQMLDVGVDCLFVNEIEAPQLLSSEVGGEWEGFSVLCTLGEAERAAEALLDKWSTLRTVVITFNGGHLLSERGGGWIGSREAVGRHRSFVLPRQKGEIVDVIGAADAFVGGFIAAQLRGASSTESLMWAHGASTRSTQASGAQEAMPNFLELRAFLDGSDDKYRASGCVLKSGATSEDALFVLSRGEPGHYQLHIDALRGRREDLRAAWAALPSTAADGSSAQAMVDDLLARLKRCDGFGRNAIERSFDAWQLCPAKSSFDDQERVRCCREEVRACLRQLATAYVLLAPPSTEPDRVLEKIAELVDPDELTRQNSSPATMTRQNSSPLKRQQTKTSNPSLSSRAVSFNISADLFPEGASELSAELQLAFEFDDDADKMRHTGTCSPENVAQAVFALLRSSGRRRKTVRAALRQQMGSDGSCRGQDNEDDFDGADWRVLLAREEFGATLRLLARCLCPIIEQRVARDELRQALLEKQGTTLLQCAAQAGVDAIVRSLLKANTTVLSDEAKDCALSAAIEDGPSRAHKEVVLLLRDRLEHFDIAKMLNTNAEEPFEGTTWKEIISDLKNGSALRERYKLQSTRFKKPMAEHGIWLADDLTESRAVVVKRVSNADKWRNECEVLTQLNARKTATAPQLVEEFEHKSDRPAEPYVIVLEEPSQRLDARPLEGLRAAGEMASISMAYRFIICAHALHDLGYVHCNLKPSDFLRFPDPRLPEESHPRLSHYDSVQKLFSHRSLADAAGEDGEAGRETVPTEIRLPDATAAYCSPEVARAHLEGVAMVVSEKMDVWSLGLILYEVFTHKPLMDECFASNAFEPLDHKNFTAEEVIISKEAADQYRHWLVREDGGQQLVEKVNSGKGLSEAQRELLRQMLRVDPKDRSSLSELLRLPLFKPPTRKITLLGVFVESNLAKLKLDVEQRNTSNAIPFGQREFCPAAVFPGDVYAKLSGPAAIRPRVLAFGGHGCADGSVAVETENQKGRESSYSMDDFVVFIGKCLELCSHSVECVFLNMCDTEKLAGAIRKAYKELTVISWKSQVEDIAASKFAEGFFTHIANASPAEAYRKGIDYAFRDAGWERTLKSGATSIVKLKQGDPFSPNRKASGKAWRCHGDGKMICLLEWGVVLPNAQKLVKWLETEPMKGGFIRMDLTQWVTFGIGDVQSHHYVHVNHCMHGSLYFLAYEPDKSVHGVCDLKEPEHAGHKKKAAEAAQAAQAKALEEAREAAEKAEAAWKEAEQAEQADAVLHEGTVKGHVSEARSEAARNWASMGSNLPRLVKQLSGAVAVS